MQIWAEYSQKFGQPARHAGGIQVCVGSSYFANIKGGAKMVSVLDRKRARIYLRKWDITALRHELAHLYLDLTWRILPYPTAERFAAALTLEKSCGLMPASAQRFQQLTDLWNSGSDLSSCELQQFLLELLAQNRHGRAKVILR